MKEHLLEYIDQAKSGNVRGLRILVEYFYALESFAPVKKNNLHVVSVFGSARVKPDNIEYQRAKRLGALLYKNGFAVVTGASRGIMAAANEGVNEAMRAEFKLKPKAKLPQAFIEKLKLYSLGLKITLPFEAEHNDFLGTVATFHYFMVRKFFFAALSSAFIACEGGWGTRDEMFEILTLVQTGKAPLMPIIYVSADSKPLQDDVEFLVRKKYVSPEDVALLQIVKSETEAVEIVNNFYKFVKSISYDKKDTIEIFLKKPILPKHKTAVQNMLKTSAKGQFSGVKFLPDAIELYNFSYKSYGYLRKIIDVLV